jgi:hypothetical protein
MKMAKASEEEWKAVMKFANELEDEIKYPEKTDEQLREWINNAPCLFRVVFGYQVLVDNCTDPAADTLEWKPEIRALLEAGGGGGEVCSRTKSRACSPSDEVSHGDAGKKL